MFWQAVGGGLTVLGYWQTYLAALLFLVLSIGPMILIGTIATKSGRAEGAVGCLSMLVMPVFQAFARVVFVLTMSPIILGLSHDAAWSFPWVLTTNAPWAVAKFVGWLVLAGIGLAFVPILGRLQSLQVLLLGSLALSLVVGIIGASSQQFAVEHVKFWPGLAFVAGLLAVGSVMAWLGTILMAFMVTAVEPRVDGVGQFVMVPVVAVLGFIPVFIYGAWLGAQIGTR